jgi:hypothetical protein
MLLTAVILIVITFLGGLGALLFPSVKREIRLPLIFAGSYLFSITIIHIIPELFVMSSNPPYVGLFILIGFFFQQFLEYFSQGIEHGHVHAHEQLAPASRWSILVALTVHSILEGSLLTHDSPFHEKHESYSLLVGIVLHKAPAAFALMVTLQDLGKKAIFLLLLFSLASPLGLYLGDFLELTDDILLILFAIVCGSFLHISTTIFVETSPNHSFGPKKILISLLAAFLAITIEFLI